MLMKKQTMLAMGLLAVCGLSVAACSNTLNGAGKDIENAGEAVRDASH